MTAPHGEDPEQAAAIRFLSDPANHGRGVATVERIDTHAAHVFLAGDRAYKMKRAVRFPFLDFSTLDKRREMCERELAFNGRTAPDIYRAVVAVVRKPDGKLALGGEGEPIEWLVAMRRFEQADLFDRMAAEGRLQESHIVAMADAVLALHETAERIAASDLPLGTCGGLLISARDTLGGLLDYPELFPPMRAKNLIGNAAAALERLTPLLERRCAAGFVRRCHGDLHLRNVCLVDGEPRLFDCIEFNDALACIDVFYDLAFLLMDLCHRDLRGFANLALNRYLAAASPTSEQDEVLAAMPFFLAVRSGIRAWVDATSASGEADPATASELRLAAQRYFGDAERWLRPPPPRLVAVGGFSGSGKSTLARAIAADIGAAPGALLLRSDVIRKRLWGVAEGDRLPPTAYAPAMSERVYETMRRRAATAIAAGHGVILDAVHDRAQDRAAVEAIAQAAGVPFTGLWLDAPHDRLAARVTARSGDASDADAAVVETQVRHGAGEIRWRRIDAAGDAADVARAAREMLGISKRLEAGPEAGAVVGGGTASPVATARVTCVSSQRATLPAATVGLVPFGQASQ